MAIIPLSEFLDSVPTSSVPLPDWTHLGVTSKDTIRLRFDEIYIDDINQNESKEGDGHTGEEIEQIKLSFGNGVSTQEFPPSVKVYTNGNGKLYKLIYGYGRSEAIRLLNQKEYYFTLLEGDEDSLEDVQAQENEQLPKRLNKEPDMRKFLSNKVRTNKIANKEDAIRAKFNKVYPNRGTDVRNRIVSQVMEDCETPQPFLFYSSKIKATDWLENHSKVDYVIDGDYDNNRDMYGIMMKEGYQKRSIVEAFERYHKSGKKTYIIGHVGAPTKKQTFKSKRQAYFDRFEELRLVFEAQGVKVWPIVLMGFLPQDKATDDMKVLIST